MRSLDGRQRAASGKTYHATCLNYAPFREHLRSSVTEVITETSIRFVCQVIGIGAAGIFFAVQHAQFGLLSAE
jgi:hypothetical protein